jgi:excisionase family DNA binding protein
MEKKLLSVKEAAEVSGVSVDTMYRWISKGIQGRRLPVVDVSTGKRANTKVRPSSLDAFLESLERAA